MLAIDFTRGCPTAELDRPVPVQKRRL